MARVPKNIRQIGGREDRVKVYMEDYVNTYLRRIQQLQEEDGMAGVLVGSGFEEEETSPPEKKAADEDGQSRGSSPSEPAGIFVSGALALSRANLEGGRVYLSQEAWTECYEQLGTYFSGQELCGIFVCEGSCRRFRRQALFAAVREAFGDREALLYILTEEGEEIFYRIMARGEERLQGYYCYFERNEAMQEYMMDSLPGRRVEWENTYERSTSPSRWDGKEMPNARETTSQPEADLYRRRAHGKEGTLGDPVERFRKKMHRQKEAAVPQKSGRGIVGLCAAMALLIFVSGLGLVYRERGGIQMKDLLERLHIDTSRLTAVSALPEETGERYEANGSYPEKEGTAQDGTEALSQGQAQSGSSVVVEEIPGNVYPTNSEHTDSGEEPSSPETTPATQATTPAESGETTEQSQTEESSTAPETLPVTESTAPSTQAETTQQTEAPALSAGTGVIYVVQAGDSLYSISRRFYGTEDMAQVIQELNDLKDADLIKEGQELLLP